MGATEKVMYLGSVIDEIIASVERAEEHALLDGELTWKSVRVHPSGSRTTFYEVAPATPSGNPRSNPRAAA